LANFESREVCDQVNGGNFGVNVGVAAIGQNSGQDFSGSAVMANMVAGLQGAGINTSGWTVFDAQSDRVFFEQTGLNFNDPNLASVMAGYGFLPTAHGHDGAIAFRDQNAIGSVNINIHSNGRVEVDIDLFNPDMGLAPAMGHFGELIAHMGGGKTDPYNAGNALAFRGVDSGVRRTCQTVVTEIMH
jgi:hypothetical protein